MTHDYGQVNAMLFDITQVYGLSGSSAGFAFDLDFSDMQFGGCFPVTEPVHASGEVKNTAGVLQLEGEVSTTLHGVCDRCAKEFSRPWKVPLHAVLETDPDSADSDDLWTFPVEGDRADLDEIVRTAFVLGMDSTLLCREDCKGLCCRCGADLNLGPCSCRPETDPRFDVLKKLLKES